MKRLIIRILRALRIRNPSPETFLIPAYAGLGNFIMMTPMILELKRRVPGARIFLLTWPSYGTDQVFDAPEVDVGCWMLDVGLKKRLPESSLDSHPKFKIQNSEFSAISGIFLLDPSSPLWRKALFFMKLRRWRFATAFIPFDACPPFVWWGFALAGCFRIIGHSMEALGINMGWTQNVLDTSVPFRLDVHEADLHFDLLDELFGEKVARNYQGHVQSGGKDLLDKYGLTAGEYIVIQLSAANALPNPKMWPLSHFSDLIKRLNSDGETIVLPGDINEKPIVDAFIKRCNLIRVVNISGLTTVSEVSTVIRHAKMLICHDSGLMQIGNAHNTPLLCIIGATDETFYKPHSKSSCVIKKGLPCSPCIKNLNKTMEQALKDCPINVQCMRDITVDEVYAACGALLRGG